MNFLSEEFVSCPPYVLVCVPCSLQNVWECQSGGPNAPHDCPSDHIVGVVCQVEQVGSDNGALLVPGVLQSLQGSHSLAPDLRHFVLQPLQHSIVDLVVQFIINAGLLPHVL